MVRRIDVSRVPFCSIDYVTFHRRVRQGCGIRGFLQFGDRFGLLPNELVNQLKARVGEDEVVEISQNISCQGNKSRFPKVPLKGWRHW